MRASLSAVQSHVRYVHAHPDGIETHSSYTAQHVELRTPHRCFRNCHCCWVGHTLDTETIVDGFGIYRCLLCDKD